MKKVVLLLLCTLFLSSASANQDYFNLSYGDYFDLEPGLYEIGKDFPTGKYDIRFNDLDEWVSVTYKDEEIEGLEPKTFTFTFSSEMNWWNPGGFLVTLFQGTLLVEHSPIRLWVEK